MICRPENDLIVHPCIPIPMRDGVHLAALIVRPARPGRFPALLARTPYGRNNEMPNFVLQAARSGYVVVVQDVRGTGESEGTFFSLQNEQEDGYDTLQWLVEQPYAEPCIGMFGGSYVGFTQFAAAASGHPALATITPRVCTQDPHDLWDNGQGAFPLQTWLEWNLSAVLSQAAVRAPQPLYQQFLEASFSLMEGVSSGDSYRILPLAAVPFLGDSRLSEHPRHALEIFGDPDFTPPFTAESIPDLPTLYIGGWYDPFTTRYLSTCTLPPGSTHKRLLIGPWDHYADNQVVGDLDFGFQASPFALNLPTVLLNWFDFVMRDIENGLAGTAPVRIFRMGANRFENFSTWPPEGSRVERLHLHHPGDPTGSLRPEMPGPEEAPGHFHYDPADPVPTAGGALLRSPRVTTGPRDQSTIESRPDVLNYRSEPLMQPCTLAGQVSLTLHVSSTAPDTDYTAKLVDIHPDGRAFNLLQGHLRMRFRSAQPAPIKPGEVYRIGIKLGATCHTFLRGHRIGLDLSSSDFPFTLRNLNTMESLLRQESWITAENTVYHAQHTPSFLDYTMAGEQV